MSVRTYSGGDVTEIFWGSIVISHRDVLGSPSLPGGVANDQQDRGPQDRQNRWRGDHSADPSHHRGWLFHFQSALAPDQSWSFFGRGRLGHPSTVTKFADSTASRSRFASRLVRVPARSVSRIDRWSRFRGRSSSAVPPNRATRRPHEFPPVRCY